MYLSLPRLGKHGKQSKMEEAWRQTLIQEMPLSLGLQCQDRVSHCRSHRDSRASCSVKLRSTGKMTPMCVKLSMTMGSCLGSKDKPAVSQAFPIQFPGYQASLTVLSQVERLPVWSVTMLKEKRKQTHTSWTWLPRWFRILVAVQKFQQWPSRLWLELLTDVHLLLLLPVLPRFYGLRIVTLEVLQDYGHQQRWCHQRHQLHYRLYYHLRYSKSWSLRHHCKLL